ncbi:hypothetical protein [Streptomyces uncialis]|uniref:hypothetical protein n=1 Tax=Streptomyces uncialis TaxID=1048205 RepID=UPI00225A4218|nr:hypothetical protein [Streptomyces uncialis]MCX4661428.1 DUF748 domain-containing protein [Streptomyces uncialis]
MNTAVKITAFAAALAASFGTAYGVGAGVDPVNAEPAAHGEHASSEQPQEKEKEKAKGEGAGGAGEARPGGLQVSEGGYTFDLGTPRIAADRETDLRFTIRDDQGGKLTSYTREHGKDLHLILASRDLTTYRHLHPELAADGTWSTPVKLPEAGDYRLFADFTPGGDAEAPGNLTLGTDLAVSGAYRPSAVPAPSRTTTVDGYTVTLAGELRPGAAEQLRLKVSKDGREVTDLQPYLGSYGHLVALRSGDLGYLHVHPGGEPGDGRTKPGPEVSFHATAPSTGTYRLFLDFQHKGEVRTAAFTVRAGEPAGGPSDATPKESGDAGESGESGGSGGSGESGDGHEH